MNATNIDATQRERDIVELLRQLNACDSQRDKKTIRRRLRAMNYFISRNIDDVNVNVACDDATTTRQRVDMSHARKHVATTTRQQQHVANVVVSPCNDTYDVVVQHDDDDDRCACTGCIDAKRENDARVIALHHATLRSQGDASCD